MRVMLRSFSSPAGSTTQCLPQKWPSLPVHSIPRTLVPSNELERPHLSQTNHAEELYEECASLCVNMFMRCLHLNDAEQ